VPPPIFLDTLRAVLGDYAITVNAGLLMASGREQHPTGLTDLDGRRYVSTIEVEDGSRLAESLVKSLTGGDMIRARRMHRDFYEFAPTHKLFLAANHKPRIRGTDEGIWSRIRLVPFEVVIPKEERDRTLGDTLRAEAGGILAWMVRGCLDWQANGLDEPSTVVEATTEYRREMDASRVGEFLDACCVPDPQGRERTAALHEGYRAWCREAGVEDPIGVNAFGRRLEERGFVGTKSNGVMFRKGLRLREGPEEALATSLSDGDQRSQPARRPPCPLGRGRLTDPVNPDSGEVWEDRGGFQGNYPKLLDPGCPEGFPRRGGFSSPPDESLPTTPEATA
jgi:putative DNA primase/helicase